MKRIIIIVLILLIAGISLAWLGGSVSAKTKEAKYTVIETLTDDMEIREYAPQIVADVVVASGDRKDAASRGFRQLFKYISGENQVQQSVAMTAPVTEVQNKVQNTEQDETTGQNIAMTAPVTEIPQSAYKTNESSPESQNIPMTTPVTEVQNADSWTIRFFMPADFTLESTPKPNNDNITISKIEPRQMAVIRFSGLGNDDALKKHETQLKEMLNEEGISFSEPAEYSFYDAPFTLPFLRRNEVMLPLN